MTEADRAILSKRLGNADVSIIERRPNGTFEVECRVGDYCHVVGIADDRDMTVPGQARTEALESAVAFFVDHAPHLFPVA